VIKDKIETAPREEIEKLQLERLKDTLQRVYTLNRFYRDSFDKLKLKPEDINSLEDIQKLPFTTKKDLRAHYPFGFFTVSMESILRIHSSSGTTGKPTVVGYTENDLNMWNELMARVYFMAGVDSRDVIHNAYGYGLFTGGLGFHYGAEKIGATIVPASGGFTKRQLMLMRDFRATVLASTPSFALHLAEVAQKSGENFKKDYSLRVGIFGAEPTSQGLKDAVSKAWGIKYFEVYGLSEIIGPGVSCSCEHSNKLHIFEDHFLAEIIDPQTGEVLEDGEFGELVITTLTKQAMPIIRYRTGDITALDKKPCRCGRTMVKMDSVIGRVDDMLIVNGVNVYPSQVEHIISLVDEVSLNYQIVAEKRGYLDKLEVVVELAKEIPENKISALKKLLENEFLNHLYINTDVTLTKPNTLQRSMGKAIRVVDKREIK
jgi:phenylacetate-CoA ligase